QQPCSRSGSLPGPPRRGTVSVVISPARGAGWQGALRLTRPLALPGLGVPRRPGSGPPHRLPDRLLRDCRTRCCLTSLVAGTASCGPGSGRPLVRRRSIPDPLAEPCPLPASATGFPPPPAGLGLPPPGVVPVGAAFLPAGGVRPGAGLPEAGVLPGGIA